jgi:hypothetical protein
MKFLIAVLLLLNTVSAFGTNCRVFDNNPQSCIANDCLIATIGKCTPTANSSYPDRCNDTKYDEFTCRHYADFGWCKWSVEESYCLDRKICKQ